MYAIRSYYANVKSAVTGNYIDNSIIEWTNEYSADPNFGNEYSFGGLTLTGNIFTCSDVASWRAFSASTRRLVPTWPA